jgi:putative aldouronate transport system permease protein
MGWGSIIYLAAMTSIDTELYEAASIDGAGRFSKMWHITLPGIIPTIITLFILRLGRLLGSNFEQIYVLYSPSVYKVGDVISTYVFREGLGKGNFSYTTAMGLFQSVIGFALVVTTNAISRRLGKGMW